MKIVKRKVRRENSEKHFFPLVERSVGAQLPMLMLSCLASASSAALVLLRHVVQRKGEERWLLCASCLIACVSAGCEIAFSFFDK